jgi:hypothetical protein
MAGGESTRIHNRVSSTADARTGSCRGERLSPADVEEENVKFWESADANVDESEVSGPSLWTFVVGWRGGGMCRDRDRMSIKVYKQIFSTYLTIES